MVKTHDGLLMVLKKNHSTVGLSLTTPPLCTQLQVQLSPKLCLSTIAHIQKQQAGETRSQYMHAAGTLEAW